jgi:BMFP domain-containing protein YqiC
MADSQDLYTRASAAAADGEKGTARDLLDELIVEQPDNEQAWLLQADMVEDSNEEYDCLQHVLAINPHNQAARQKLEALLIRVPELDDLNPAKEQAEAAKKVAEAKKEDESGPPPDGALDLDHLDQTPLFGDKNG